MCELAAAMWASCANLPGAIVAYIGPGAGLSAIGAALALIFGVLLTFLGFVWYPLKRMLRSARAKKAPPPTGASEEAEGEPTQMVS